MVPYLISNEMFAILGELSIFSIKNISGFPGTDLWEANLRNGGMPPPQGQAQKTPWGHTPSSNIGGTWGEDDEGDASNVWTGIPPASGSAPQWPNQPPIWPGKSICILKNQFLLEGRSSRGSISKEINKM